MVLTSPAQLASIKTENGKQKIVWKDISRLPDKVRRVIASVKNTPSGINIETLDRMKALDLLIKYMGIEEKDVSCVTIEGEAEIEQ